MKYPETESYLIECKSTLPKNDQIVKTIIGFCNRNGGKIVIGVEDNGNIVGVDETKVQYYMEYLDQLIYESTAPPIIPRIYSQLIGEKTILIIEVSSGMNKPYYLKSEGLEKGVYIRLGRSTHAADADTIEELKWQSRGKTFDMMPVYHAHESEIDQKLVSRFLKHKTGTKNAQATKDHLDAYHLTVSEHGKVYPTVAGLLLFGVRPQYFFSEAFIICSHFAGISGREALATVDCTGTVFEQVDTAFNFIVSRLNRSFVIESKKRKEELEIPEVAIREILLNAIVHRNYHIKAPTKIAIYDNRIEVFSPGDFPGPLNQHNLLMGLTYLRNPAICKVFREADYIEKLGTGFLNVFRSYEERRLKQPQINEGENFVKCILPRKTVQDLGITLESEGRDQKLKILALLDVAEGITIADVITTLGIPRSTAGRRLKELVEEDRLKKVGTKKGAFYKKTKS